MPGELPRLPVQRVVDGDTLRLKDGRSVRLIGINSPELGRSGKPAEPFAEAARRRLQALVAANDGYVRLRVGVEPRDRYGRTLAHLYDDAGRNLEARLLAEGLGFRVAVAPNVALVGCQRDAENEARKASLGLWRAPVVREARQVDSGGFAVIRGRVEGVERNRGGLWLSLGHSLVLRVAPADLRAYFDEPALRRLLGKRIEVRGWVVDRARRGALEKDQARWMLPLSHAAMLERLP